MDDSSSLSNVSNYTKNVASSTTTTPDIYSQINNILNLAYPMVLCGFGTLFNAAIFIIYLRSKTLSKINTSFYISLQAIFDVLVIYLGTIRYFILGVTGVNIKNTSVFWCKSINYLIDIVNFTSVWLLVLTSAHSVVFILNVKKLAFMLKRSAQVIFVCAIILVGSAIFVISPINLNLKASSKAAGSPSCSEDKLYLRQILNVIESTTIVLVPFIALMICSFILILVIRKSAKKFKYQPSSAPRSSSVVNTSSNVALNVKPEQKPKSKSKAQNLSLTLLTLNVSFLVFNLPYSALSLYSSFSNQSSTQINFAITIATIIRYSYYAFTIMAHIFSNRIFKKTLADFFKNIFSKCKCKR